MNAIFFGLKRAYHGTLRVSRRALARRGLTAARFDLLYVVKEAGRRALQRDLRRALGVSAPTVSRMVDSLEALGWVERERCVVDRRMRYVRLTREGLRCIRGAIARFVRSGWAQDKVDRALCPGSRRDGWKWLLRDGRLPRTTAPFCAAYRDRATLYYPWHPDD